MTDIGLELHFKWVGLNKPEIRGSAFQGWGARCLDKARKMFLSQDSEDASLTEAKIEMKSWTRKMVIEIEREYKPKETRI